MVNISMKYFKIITKRIINTTTVYISWTRKVSHLISRTSFCLYELISFSFSLPLFLSSSLRFSFISCEAWIWAWEWMRAIVWALSMFIALGIIIVVKQFFFVFSLNIAHCICGWQANDLEDNESFFCERARLYVTTGFYA